MPWPIASKDEYIDIIAPSGAISAADIVTITEYLQKLGLRPRIPNNLIGDHPFCANSDEMRFALLRTALNAQDSTLLWCVRGGHGVSRIMADLIKLPKPSKQKLLIGFSDISSLHLWFNQAWQWPSIHGPGTRLTALGEIDANDIQSLYQLCFAGLADYSLNNLMPLNTLAKNLNSIEGITTGGCLSVLQTSIGTPWQIDTRNKILFLEDVNEHPYRIDRALVHLANAGLLNAVKAIILGDFGEKPDEAKTIDWVLKESISDYLLKHHIPTPMFRLRGFGHGTQNKPLPFGVKAKLTVQGTTGQLTFA